MSLNPYDLVYGDEVVFGGKVLRKVEGLIYDNRVYRKEESIIVVIIRFDDGRYLELDDPLWELAELTKPKLPIFLFLSRLDNDGENYISGCLQLPMSPSRLLNRLRKDVKMLEEACVKEEKEE